MRTVLALWMLVVSTICERAGSPAPATPPPPPPPPPRVNFAAEILPTLDQRCRPCHFEGGVMYSKLPFDDPKTVLKLGTKLFSRIKDEKTREAIRKLLAEQ